MILTEQFEVHDCLNPKIWTSDNILRDDVKLKILEIIENDSDNILTENEILVGNTLINLLENWDFILTEDGSNKLNKSSFLSFVRETTLLDTKEIRDSMRKFRVLYRVIKQDIIE